MSRIFRKRESEKTGQTITYPIHQPRKQEYQPSKVGLFKIERKKPMIRAPESFKIKVRNSTGEEVYTERGLTKLDVMNRFKISDEELATALNEGLPVEKIEENNYWEEIRVEKETGKWEKRRMFVSMPRHVFTEYIEAVPGIDVNENELLRSYVRGKIGTDEFQIINSDLKKHNDLVVLTLRYAS